MARHRNHLPQLDGGCSSPDGGIETTLIFHDGLDSPLFAAFHLLRDEAGRKALRRYQPATPCLPASRLWASSSRARPGGRAPPGTGHTDGAGAVERGGGGTGGDGAAFEGDHAPMVVSGCVGPRGDGYSPRWIMSVAEAEAYHATQIRTFAGTEADMVTAITMTHAEEAIGVVLAACAAGLPVAVSFTLETDGRLPSGYVGVAVEAVDAATDAARLLHDHCAHPTHFRRAGRGWGRAYRIRGCAPMPAAAAELDAATELDEGDPVEPGAQHAELRHLLPGLAVLGGCCGTDHRHVEAIAHACR